MTTVLLLVGCAADAPAPYAVWVADLDGRIHAFDGLSGERAADPVRASELVDLQPSAVLADGPDLWLTDFATGRVLLADRHTGTVTTALHHNRPGHVRLEEPCALVPAGDGSVWVLGNDTRNAVRLGASEVEELGGASGAPMTQAHGLTTDGTLVWVGVSPRYRGQRTVQLWDPASGERIASLGHPEDLVGATDVLLHEGALWVADWYGGQVVRLDPWTGALLDRPAPDLPGALSLAAAPDGSMWVLGDAGLWQLGDTLALRVSADALGTPRSITIE